MTPPTKSPSAPCGSKAPAIGNSPRAGLPVGHGGVTVAALAAQGKIQPRQRGAPRLGRKAHPQQCRDQCRA